VAEDKSKKIKKPISYFYNPFYKIDENELQFLEVWQVLEDDVLGSLYPWQYVATAEMSNRIVTLNFLALKNFENDYKKYYDQLFVYKVSAKLLSEGNVHRLGGIIQSNLVLCFDIYQLEKFGDKQSLAGLKFLQNIGATIMINGVDKAPVDILLKYPAQYYLLDYRYYNEQNQGLLTMIKQLAATNSVGLVVGNVVNKDNLDIFKKAGLEIFSGSALQRPKRRVDSFVKESKGEVEEETQASKYVVKDVEAPEIKDKPQQPNVEETKPLDEIQLDVTSSREMFRARLAKIATQKAQIRKEREEQKQIEEITIDAADLDNFLESDQDNLGVSEVNNAENKASGKGEATKAQVKDSGVVSGAKVEALSEKQETRKPRNAPMVIGNAKSISDKKTNKDNNINKEIKGVKDEAQAKSSKPIKKDVPSNIVKEEASAKSKLRSSTITTSTDEFASLNKEKNNKKTTMRGENVIKLNISKPKKKR